MYIAVTVLLIIGMYFIKDKCVNSYKHWSVPSLTCRVKPSTGQSHATL